MIGLYVPHHPERQLDFTLRESFQRRPTANTLCLPAIALTDPSPATMTMRHDNTSTLLSVRISYNAPDRLFLLADVQRFCVDELPSGALVARIDDSLSKWDALRAINALKEAQGQLKPLLHAEPLLSAARQITRPKRVTWSSSTKKLRADKMRQRRLATLRARPPPLTHVQQREPKQ